VITPFVDHRDDTQDRSVQLGLNTTFVYQIHQLESVSLDYQIAQRHVYEYRFGDLASGEIDLLTFLTQVSQGLLTSAGANLNSSTFTLSGILGTLDDPANPHRGALIRPAIQVTAPTSFSSTAYWRLDARAYGYLPLGRRSVLAARFALGRLLPYGKSIPGPDDDPASKALQLRDASFTTGGTGEVRGWEDRLLGPKVPNILFSSVGDSLIPRAEGYVPVGGFQRTLFSLELRLPFPWLGPNFGSRFFLDGGRVWTDDARFGREGDPNGQEKLFVATGTGIDLRTPVGPIETSVAYKLNPSITDLVDASDMLLAVQQGRPIDTLPRRNGRRWQFHLAIGTSF
jgi:outer membrane protein insertion porin family